MTIEKNNTAESRKCQIDQKSPEPISERTSEAAKEMVSEIVSDMAPGSASEAASSSETGTTGAWAAGSPTSTEGTQITNRRPLKSKKLDRTLAELETAFAAWDSITDAPEAPEKAAQHAAHSGPKDTPSSGGEQDFRTKTRKLLHQLREQISELSED